jgi:hypothetical protein
MDSSLFKTFPLREKLSLQFRVEAFNTFNTPWFGQANTTFGNARFGLLGNSQANDPRNVQLAAKGHRLPATRKVSEDRCTHTTGWSAVAQF